jgi:outer membrane protein TolC
MFHAFSCGTASANRRYAVLLLALVCAAPAPALAQLRALTLEHALRLSIDHSAGVRGVEAGVSALREAAVRAGQLPDPVLKAGLDNLPVNGPDQWSLTRDFMTMRRVGIEQQWVGADKRQARSERAQRAVELEQATYFNNVAKVREETAKAWLAMLYAQRVQTLYRQLEGELQNDLEAVRAAHRGARASASDVTQAESAAFQASDGLLNAEQDAETARLALERWINEPVQAVADQTPALDSHVPGLPLAQLERYHPMLLTAKRALVLAEADVELATRERRQDWSVEVTYSQRGPQYSNMVSAGISIPLAMNPAQRQDRDIAEKTALAARARHQYEEALRELKAEIRSLNLNIERLRERSSRLRAGLLPSATKQVELAYAAYRAGGGSLSAVYGARRSLLERRLQILEVEREAALNWARLEFHVIPHDADPAGTKGQQ